MAKSICLLVAFSCSNDAHDTDATGTTADAASAAGCPLSQQRADGSCCANGRYFEHSTGTCLDVGPAACAQTLLSDPGACQPRWCWTWSDSQGHSCQRIQPGCMPEARPCKADETWQGCVAGKWPATTGDDCITAGGSAQAAALVDSKPTPLTAAAPPAGVPPLEPLPPPEQTRFCHLKGAVALCGVDEQGCGPGRMAQPDAPSKCMDVGTAWSCPPGFVEDAAGTPVGGGLTACKPDPEECGAGPWPDTPTFAVVRYVSAGAKPGGDGSKTAPFGTIAAALSAAPADGVVAIGAGAYQENLVVAKPVQLLGLCAAKVTLQAAVGGAIVRVAGAGAGEVSLRGMRLTGAATGIIADGGLRLRLARVEIAATKGYGIWARKTQVTASDVLIQETSALPGGESGIGLFMNGGAKATLDNVRLRHNRTVGVFVRDPASVLVASSLLVDGTRERNFDGLMGNGLVVGLGASATLRSCRVHANRSSGVSVSENASLHATGLLVDGTLARPDGQWGFGLTVSLSSTATLRGVRLTGNRSRGLDVNGSGSQLDAQGLLVDATREQISSASLGTGVYIATGAQAIVTSARISDSRSVGLAVFATGTHATVNNLLVDGTRAEIAGVQPGFGAVVSAGGRLTLKDAWLVDNRGAGLAAAESPSLLEATGLLIDGTRDTPPVWPGFGVAVGKGARATIEGARVSDNRAIAVVVVNPQSLLKADELIIDGTRGTADTGTFGAAMLVASGGHARLRGGRVSDNRMYGLVVYDPTSRLETAGLLVDNTLVVATMLGGLNKFSSSGLMAGQGATMRIAGSRLPANDYVGVTFNAGAAAGSVVGSVVADTRVGPGVGGYGTSISTYNCAGTIEVAASRLVGNRSAGVSFTDTDGAIRDVVIFDTGAGKFVLEDPDKAPGERDKHIELADGVVAKGQGTLVVERSVLSRQSRAGILVDGPVQATVRSNLISHGHFGLVSQGGAKLNAEKNLLLNNITNTTGDAGLFVPAPPQVLTP